MKERRKLDRMYAVPLLFVLAIIPLVVLIAVYHTDIGNNSWMSGTAFYDFFLYYKSHLLIMVGLIVGIVLIFAMMTGCQGNVRGKNSWLCLVPAGVFAVSAFVSAVASEHRSDALFGGYEQFEGLFVLLCYVFCFVFSYLYVTDEKWTDLLFYSLLVGSLVLSAAGALQTFGIDYMTSRWMLPFLTMFLDDVPEGFSITASFGEGVSYATLFNPNYVGTYVALVLPVTAALGLWGKKRIFRVLAWISAALQIVMLFGAKSMTGLLGVVGAGAAAVVFLFSDVRRNRKLLAGIGGVAVIAALFIFLWKPGILKRFTETTLSAYNDTVASIETAEGSFVITLGNGRTIRGDLQPDGVVYQFSLTDGDGGELAVSGDLATGVTIKGEEYTGITLTADKKQLTEGEETKDYDVLRISAGADCSWELLKYKGKLYYINSVGKLDRLRKVPSWGFERRYDFATNRGYIWSRTLPLLKETVVIGKGADNFVYAFPNDDYVGKVNCGFGRQTVTKPHNMYMQIWVQDGMFACIAFLLLYLILAVKVFRRCFVRGKLSYLQKMLAAVFCGGTGYMVAGIANDSTICVAPIFWVLLGTGYAAAEIIRMENK